MVKKIFISVLVALAFIVLGGYFAFATMLYNAGEPKNICKDVKVTLLDSAQNRFVTKAEVVEIIDGFMGKSEGKKIEEIDLNLVEQLLNQRSAIKESQVSITREGTLNIDITQRKPVLRIHSKNGGFYVDETQYIFPLVPSFTSYVPIVSGNIPFTLNAEHRGLALEDEENWMEKILDLGNYMSSDPFWSAQIEQIYIDGNGDILLAPRVGEHKIIFGDLNDIDEKFNKLYTFYKNIIPAEGWDKYSSVNLKYKDQIICKLKNKKSK